MNILYCVQYTKSGWCTPNRRHAEVVNSSERSIQRDFKASDPCQPLQATGVFQHHTRLLLHARGIITPAQDGVKATMVKEQLKYQDRIIGDPATLFNEATARMPMKQRQNKAGLTDNGILSLTYDSEERRACHHHFLS